MDEKAERLAHLIEELKASGSADAIRAGEALELFGEVLVGVVETLRDDAKGNV